MTLDDSREKLGAKIRLAELAKVPYILTLGERESTSEQVSVRSRKLTATVAKPWPEFFHQLLEEVANRSLSLSTFSSTRPPPTPEALSRFIKRSSAPTTKFAPAKFFVIVEAESKSLGVMGLGRGDDRGAQARSGLWSRSSPAANPPVCKILDFGKFKYNLEKKDKDTQARTRPRRSSRSLLST